MYDKFNPPSVEQVCANTDILVVRYHGGLGQPKGHPGRRLPGADPNNVSTTVRMLLVVICVSAVPATARVIFSFRLRGVF